MASLRNAEAQGLDAESVLAKLVGERPLFGSDDPAAVLHHRFEQWAGRAATGPHAGSDELIAGLIPRALRVSDPDFSRALTEREQALQQRAHRLAAEADTNPAEWIATLGPSPTNSGPRARWLEQVTTVAAYRARWGIGGPTPLGPKAPGTVEQLDQRRRARAAAQRAGQLARSHRQVPTPVDNVHNSGPTPEVTL